MADEEKKILKDDEVAVPQATLTEIMTRLSETERLLEETRANQAGREELGSDAAAGEKKLREKQNFEPKFRTVRLRKYPMHGKHEDMGYVVGWTSRGAFQTVDRTGTSPVIVDMIEVIYLDHERNPKGVLQAEAIPLLKLMNEGIAVHCKVIERTVKKDKKPTGEEINVSVFDEKHGLVRTGDVVDGYVEFTDIQLKIQIPGRVEPVEIDSKFVNY